jgi:hypothetical protein
MLPNIEYLWSIFAVTQAIIITLQVGSKLLLFPSVVPPPPPQHASAVLERFNPPTDSSLLVNISNALLDSHTNNSSTKIDTMTSADDDGNDDIDSSSAADRMQRQNDLIMAFRRATQLALQQDLKPDRSELPYPRRYTTAMEDETMTSTTRIPYIVGRNVRQGDERTVEPYRMSFVPVLTNPPPTIISSATPIDDNSVVEISNEEILDTFKARGHSNNETTPTIDRLDLDEYWETQYTIRNISQTVSTTSQQITSIVARIRVYAPKTFQTLRTYFGMNDVSYQQFHTGYWSVYLYAK